MRSLCIVLSKLRTKQAEGISSYKLEGVRQSGKQMFQDFREGISITSGEA